MAEWPNAYAWKAYMAEMSSGVRIPPSPQNYVGKTQSYYCPWSWWRNKHNKICYQSLAKSWVGASGSAFAQSIRLCESREDELADVDRLKIMTVRAMFGDELVPSDTTILKGAYNIKIPTPEHIFSIGMALTLLSKPIILFITDPNLPREFLIRKFYKESIG